MIPESYKRVWQSTIKPSRDEFKKIVLVTGVGVLVIGVIGFLLTIAKQVIFR